MEKQLFQVVLCIYARRYNSRIFLENSIQNSIDQYGTTIHLQASRALPHWSRFFLRSLYVGSACSGSLVISRTVQARTTTSYFVGAFRTWLILEDRDRGGVFYRRSCRRLSMNTLQSHCKLIAGSCLSAVSWQRTQQNLTHTSENKEKKILLVQKFIYDNNEIIEWLHRFIFMTSLKSNSISSLKYFRKRREIILFRFKSVKLSFQ